MKYNNRLTNSDISARELSLDPVTTGSGAIFDDGTDIIEFYNSVENKIEKLEAKTNIRLNLDDIINSRRFKSEDEVKEFNKKLIKDLDRFLAEY
jgi:hypothetical protein